MRHAIYFTPGPDDPLNEAAASWLGRDAFGCKEIAIDHGFGHLVKAPSRYGFHGTLKAPFGLADGKTQAELRSALDAFSAETEPFSLSGLKIGRLGPFFALVPSLSGEALDQLAADVIRVFEPFRAPLTDNEIARRNPDTLSKRQRENLERWGYPYVFDDFRFHMTLTGPVDEADAAAVEAELRKRFSHHCEQPLQINALALFVEPSSGAPFVVDYLSGLRGATASQSVSV